MSDEIKISDSMTLREQVARALYAARPDYSVHTDEYPWEETKAWDSVPADWQEAYFLLADAALSLITEACAKVAEECANEVDESHVVFYVSERIRQMGKP